MEHLKKEKKKDKTKHCLEGKYCKIATEVEMTAIEL